MQLSLILLMFVAACGTSDQLVVDAGRASDSGTADASRPSDSGTKDAAAYDAEACPHEADLQPLDPGCSDAICHVLIRLDYQTLGLRGWAVSSGPSQPVDAAQATHAAQAVFEANKDEYYDIGGTGDTGRAEAGLFSVSAAATDFGGFALVGERSGIVIAAGGVVYAGRGDYWTPKTWRPASDIRCGDTQASPATQALDDSSCKLDKLSTTMASQAMNIALSTNLALALSAQGSFQARAYLYTPSVGACIPDVAEWLVVLTR